MPRCDRKRHPSVVCWWGLFVLALVMAGTALAGDVPSVPLSFGVVPQQAASVLAENWTPVLERLAAASGVPLKFATAPSIPVFEERLGRGDYDLAYMNPYHYVVFHKRVGYIALAREKNRRIQGIIVVRNASPLQDIRELAGSTLALPAPAAFAASILPLAVLKAQGVPVTPHFSSSHDSVYRAVAKGLVPAGGGIPRTLEMQDEGTREQLRVLWRTPFYTSHAIAVHPRVAERVRAALLGAMTALAEEGDGGTLLAKIGFKGIEPGNDEDWNDIRALDLHLLDLASTAISPTP